MRETVFPQPTMPCPFCETNIYCGYIMDEPDCIWKLWCCECGYTEDLTTQEVDPR